MFLCRKTYKRSSLTFYKYLSHNKLITKSAPGEVPTLGLPPRLYLLHYWILNVVKERLGELSASSSFKTLLLSAPNRQFWKPSFVKLLIQLCGSLLSFSNIRIYHTFGVFTSLNILVASLNIHIRQIRDLFKKYILLCVRTKYNFWTSIYLPMLHIYG